MCIECGADWSPVRRGECSACGSDVGSCRAEEWVAPAPIDVPDDDDAAADDAGPGDSVETVADSAETVADDADGADDDADGADEPPADEPAAAPPRTTRPPAKGAGKRKPFERYDWPGIKKRYVEGTKGPGDEVTEWPSLETVANHFGVTPSRVRERAAMEGWTEQRRQWQAYVERTRQQAKAAGLARIGQDLDNRAVDATKLGLQLCIAVLTERAQAAQAARSAGGKAGDALNALELTRLAQAVDLWHRIGLRAVGDPDVTRVEITGAHGGPIEISEELRRDDPDRMATVLSVLQQAGMGDIFGGAGGHVASGAVALERGDDGTYTPSSPG